MLFKDLPEIKKLHNLIYNNIMFNKLPNVYKA